MHHCVFVSFPQLATTGVAYNVGNRAKLYWDTRLLYAMVTDTGHDTLDGGPGDDFLFGQVRVSICVSVCVCVCLYACLSVCPFVCVCMFVCLFFGSLYRFVCTQ